MRLGILTAVGVTTDSTTAGARIGSPRFHSSVGGVAVVTGAAVKG